MAQLLEYVKMALMNIRSNKGRSLLTMLGIIIGISSVIMVLSIGNGVSASVTEGLNSLAGGQLNFSINDSAKDKTVEYFTPDLYAEIEERFEHVKGVTPQAAMWGTARTPKGNFEIILVTGTPALSYASTNPIIKGHFFTQTDYENGAAVCVLKESDAVKLFGTSDVVGKTFEANLYGVSAEMKIIGIRKDSDSSLVMSAIMEMPYMEVTAPMSTLGAAYGYYLERSNDFYVFTDGPQYATQTAGEIMQFLRNKYRLPAGSDNIKMEDFNDSMDDVSETIGYITVFVVLVAAISLLVGGIGVMNIMLVSVTERTREIGIRKALGARTGSIMLQFLSEAAIITLLGGVIGIVLGQLGAAFVCRLMKIAPSISVGMIAAATLFSTSVGLFFGIYPAKKAAKLSPIEALRHE